MLNNGRTTETDNGIRSVADGGRTYHPPVAVSIYSLSLLILQREKPNYPFRYDKAIWPNESHRLLLIYPSLETCCPLDRDKETRSWRTIKKLARIENSRSRAFLEMSVYIPPPFLLLRFLSLSLVAEESRATL